MVGTNPRPYQRLYMRAWRARRRGEPGEWVRRRFPSTAPRPIEDGLASELHLEPGCCHRCGLLSGGPLCRLCRQETDEPSVAVRDLEAALS